VINIRPRKPDAEAIRSHIEELKRQPWLGPAQTWWPDFLFRFDHITAAASILNDGKLLSRSASEGAGKIIFDSASPGIIKHTTPWCKDHVRLYFRPRTPTQYSIEGIRLEEEYRHGGRCPIPVVMLFSAREILTLRDTVFSDGNLAASRSDCGSDAGFLRRIPFRHVYHDESEGINVFHRNAEVIYPKELDLFALLRICSRSSAERDTLISLLTPEAAARWASRISVGSKLNLHLRRWTFLEEVELDHKSILCKFNPSTKTPGPFRLEIHVQSAAGRLSWELDPCFARGNVLTSDIGDLTEYDVEITLGGEMIYKNHYESLPDIF
jgi:hypothetical protein